MNRVQFHDDVTKQFALGGIADGPFVTQLIELSDIVENRRSNQQIEIEIRVVSSDLVGQAAQTDHVLEQTTDVRMMHHLGGRSALVKRSDFRVVQHREIELAQKRIGDSVGKVEQLHPQLADVFFCVRQKVREIDFFRLGYTPLQDGQLWPVTVELDASLHLHEVVTRNVLSCGFKEVPHTRFDRAAAVPKGEAQVGLTFARVANFLLVYQKKRGDVLFAGKIGDESRFHVPERG